MGAAHAEEGLHLPCPRWVVGVVFCVVSTAFTALGLVLQKFSHVKNEKSGKGMVYYRQPWWLVGLVVFALGQVLNLVAMALAPQTMLSCLGSLSLVFNTVFAWTMLGERVQRGEVVPMAGMVLGVLLVVSTTPRDGGNTSDDVVGAILHARFLTVAAGLAVTLLVLWLLARHKAPDLMAFFWAFSTSVVGSYTVTLFKGASLMVGTVQDSWRHPPVYVFILLALMLSVLQVHTLNKALRKGDAVTVVPTYFACGVLLQLLQAELAFQELHGLTGTLPVLLFLCGVALVLACTLAIVRAQVIAEDGLPDSDAEEPLPITSATPLQRKSHSAPQMRRSHGSFDHLDPGAFRNSFDGEDRFYLVSLVGPPGIA